MLTLLKVIEWVGFAGVAWLIILFGLMNAFFPINDKETSAGHRLLWCIITTGILFTWYSSWGITW